MSDAAGAEASASDDQPPPDPAAPAGPAAPIAPAAQGADAKPAVASQAKEPPTPMTPSQLFQTPAAMAGTQNWLAWGSLGASILYFAIGISLGASGRTDPAPPWLLALPVLGLIGGYAARVQIDSRRQKGRYIASLAMSFGFAGVLLFAFGVALHLLTSH